MKTNQRAKMDKRLHDDADPRQRVFFGWSFYNRLPTASVVAKIRVERMTTGFSDQRSDHG